MNMNKFKLILFVCLLSLWGCNSPRPAESNDAADSLIDSSVVASPDTVSVDSFEQESDVPDANKEVVDGMIITWHHLTKTLYEVEFCSPKLRQDIAQCIESFEKKDIFFARSRFFNLSIDSTHVSIMALEGHDEIDLLMSPHELKTMSGYSNFGERIAIVHKTPYVINTYNNPIDLNLKWQTWDVVDPSKIRIDIIDDSGLYGFKINPEDYMPSDSLSIDECE